MHFFIKPPVAVELVKFSNHFGWATAETRTSTKNGCICQRNIAAIPIPSSCSVSFGEICISRLWYLQLDWACHHDLFNVMVFQLACAAYLGPLRSRFAGYDSEMENSSFNNVDVDGTRDRRHFLLGAVYCEFPPLIPVLHVG